MRRLTIGWNGSSNAIGSVRQILEQYGHACGAAAVDLWIDDGSQPLTNDPEQAPRISLRLGVGPVSNYGLPALQLRAYDACRRLYAVLDIAEETSGNGQRLRLRVTNTLVEWVALHVSGFARDPGFFSTGAVANDWPEKDLRELEVLAFLHRFNGTANPELMREAQAPVIERLQASLRIFAERPALNIDGNEVTYDQLRVLALAIQARLRPLLRPAETPPVIGVCLEKSIELYASILAVLGCGAVYLPLGSDHPPQRHQAMLESAGAHVLLDAGHHPMRGHFNALDVTAVDVRATEITHSLMHHRPPSDAPCMALFTSGTSGQP